jgi:hypothetical protein
VSDSAVATPNPPTITEPTRPASISGRLLAAAVLLAAGSVFAIIGSMMPWISARHLTKIGVKGDGMFVLALAAVGLTLSILALIRRKFSRGTAIAAILLGAACIAIVGNTIMQINGAGSVGLSSRDVGAGLFVGGFGAGLVALAGLLAVFQRAAVRSIPAPAVTPHETPSTSHSDRLQGLAELRDRGLLTAEEYDEKRKAILAKL